MSGPRPGRGALFILALFLAAAGALRLGSGIGLAIAGTAEAPSVPEHPQDCGPPPEALAAALKAREDEVIAKEVALADRKAAIALADAAITKRLQELTSAEDNLKQVLAIADGAAEQDLSRLTAVYEAMKPTDAAAIFAAMDPDFAAGFLGRMQPGSAAAVLAGMTPEQAYAISALIAGRNARAPKN